MKRFTSVLTTIAVVGLFAGTWVASASPVGAAGPHPDASLHASISFWNAYSTIPNQVAVVTNKIIPAFNKLYPNVKVTNDTLPYTGMETKLLTSIPAGTGPDVVRTDIIWQPTLAAGGDLVRTDKFPYFNSLKSQVFPGALKTNYYKGHYYGLPLDTNTTLLMGNKTVLHEAGIKNLPTTIAQFDSDCKTIKAKLLKKGVYCYGNGGTDAWNDLPWVWTFGGSLTNSTFSKATGYFNSKKTINEVTWEVNLLKNKEMNPGVLGGGLATSNQLCDNLVAFINDGPWMPGIFAGSCPKMKYDLGLMPRGAGGAASVVGGEDIAVSKDATGSNLKASEAFVQFMLTKKVQIWMGNYGLLPILKGTEGSKALPSYFKIFDKQLQTAKPRTPSPNWTEIDNVVANSFQSALRGQGTPSSILNSAAKTIDGYLK